jgi:hypothetical protein
MGTKRRAGRRQTQKCALPRSLRGETCTDQRTAVPPRANSASGPVRLISAIGPTHARPSSPIRPRFLIKKRWISFKQPRTADRWCGAQRLTRIIGPAILAAIFPPIFRV